MIKSFPTIFILLSFALTIVKSDDFAYNPVTVNDDPCVIPFLYKGVEYHDCITVGSDRLWCYTDTVNEKWEYCKPKPKEFEGCKLASPNITMEEVNIILAEHNNFRSQMPALRMRKLTWNSELAQRAQAAAESCKHLHVETELCGDRDSMGQNLFYTYYAGNFPGDLDWKNVISLWSREQKYYDINAEEKCQPHKICGHFTQVAWANTYEVGCGKGFCHGNVNGQIAYSIQYYCNYFTGGNYGDRPPYIVSTGEKCKDCHIFDIKKTFRCDKSQLCETCDKSMTGCIGMEDIKKMAASGKLCADTDVNCALNAGICDIQRSGMSLPPQVTEYLLQCKKTCNTCT